MFLNESPVHVHVISILIKTEDDVKDTTRKETTRLCPYMLAHD